MNFDYISAKEAAAKIGVTERWVQQLCKDGRVEGAQRLGEKGVWLVPLQWVRARMEAAQKEKA